MKTYSHSDPELLIARSHPWNYALSDPSHVYYDLKMEPERIRTSLEDFVALGQNVATTAFYELIEWLNGPDSALESNDCGARPIHENRNTNFPKKFECTARLMILFRDLPLNLVDGNTVWLEDAVQRYLHNIDPEFEWSVVGTTLVPANYVTLELPESDQRGKQLLLSFWAWGDDDDEIWSNLGRTFANAQQALVEVSNDIHQASSVRGT
jgi:hypothetical protein